MAATGADPLDPEGEPPPRAERIEPEEQDFDPDAFTAEDARASLAEGARLFGEARYHEAHEAFERCWLATEGADPACAWDTVPPSLSFSLPR